MKKAMIGMVFFLALATGIYAGGNRDTTTIEGKLAVTNAIPTIVSGDKTWALPHAAFYQTAWENGLKVGDTVKAEGYVIENRAPNGFAANSATVNATDGTNVVMFMPTKVWVNGKAIDISTCPGPNGRGFGPMGGSGYGGRGGMMYGDYDDRGYGYGNRRSR